MWMRCCAVCRWALRKARLCDHTCWHAGGNGDSNGNRGSLSSTYLRSSENRAENGFRPSSAGRSFRFPHSKRSQHDTTSLRFVPTPAKSQRIL